MKTIWKAPLILGQNFVAFPQGATILTAQMQGEQLCVWAEVDTEKPLETREFRVYGTGWELDEPKHNVKNYIATVQVGPYVWHVYEFPLG